MPSHLTFAMDPKEAHESTQVNNWCLATPSPLHPAGCHHISPQAGPREARISQSGAAVWQVSSRSIMYCTCLLPRTTGRAVPSTCWCKPGASRALLCVHAHVACTMAAWVCWAGSTCLCRLIHYTHSSECYHHHIMFSKHRCCVEFRAYPLPSAAFH